MTKDCLVVDDSSVVRKIIKKILEDIGFQVREAEDGKKALEACEEQVPFLIMLDWNMPIMDGMEFLKAFHAKQQEHGTYVVFCTTENDITQIMKAMEAGANEYIMKPFDADIIKTKFQQLGIL